MKKINSVKHDKVWGYEIWLYSPVKGKETTFEDGTKCEGGPLIKIIKANQPLSVQVHPNDNWAKILENQDNGKSESWYVLDAEKDASLVLGLKNFDEKIIREKLANKTFQDELKLVPIKPGDFFNIPAGLIHGIGAGSTIFEVQQPSDVTYRYYDYDRLENGKPRELHVDKAIKVQKDLDYHLKPVSLSPLKYQNEVGYQMFLSTPFTPKEDVIVVDLKTYDTFYCSKGEGISLEKYAIISLK